MLIKSKIYKIIYFTSAQIGPYHMARFAKLLENYPNALIVGISSGSPPRPWNTDYEKLGKNLIVIGDQGFRTNREKSREIMRIIETQAPEVIILAGYKAPGQWAAARWAKRKGVPRIMSADSCRGDHPRFFLKEMIKKYVFVRPMADAAFVPGIRGLEYLNSLGLPVDAIWRGLYVVDNGHFSQGASEARREQARHRAAFGLPDNYFLVTCRLSPEKNLVGLIKAFARYQAQGGAWSLVIVGTGPQMEELTKLAATITRDKVMFAGWQQYEALPIFYGLASCFLLPSISEPWGLTVNEAMASGLPVLVSRRCGCQPELCHRGINGFDFDPLDEKGLAALMLRISSGEVDLEAMGTASRQIIAHFSLDNWMHALRDCIESTGARLAENHP